MGTLLLDLLYLIIYLFIYLLLSLTGQALYIGYNT